MQTGYEQSWNEIYGLDKDPVRNYLLYPLIDEISGDLSGKTILDAGCGNGGLLNHFNSQKYQKAVGVDGSSEFIDAARKNISSDRVDFIQSDLLKTLPFEDQSFDFAYSVFVLNELPKIDLHLNELSRILRSDGQALIVTTHPFLTMYYHLYEKFTGKKNDKLIGVKGYFDKNQIEYIFTLAKTGSTFFQHTFEELLNSLLKSNMKLVSLIELKTDNINFQSIPSYWDTKDIPKYLVLHARKQQPNRSTIWTK